MIKKNEGKQTGEFSVKAVITKDFEKALQIIEEKFGIARSNVVRTALKEYIEKNYPGFLPKSKSEIMNEVKQKYYFDKYNKEFHNLEFMKERIPILEEGKKKLQSQISDEEKKLNTVKKKINEKVYTSKTELRELENQKSRFEENLKYKKNVKKQDDKELEEYKKGIFVERASL